MAGRVLFFDSLKSILQRGVGGGGGWRAYRSRIHERTILLRFLGIILRGLRLEVSVYNVYITNQLLKGEGGGGKSVLELTVNNKEENSWDCCPNYVHEFGLWILDTQNRFLSFLLDFSLLANSLERWGSLGPAFLTGWHACQFLVGLVCYAHAQLRHKKAYTLLSYISI